MEKFEVSTVSDHVCPLLAEIIGNYLLLRYLRDNHTSLVIF